jgi:hypothetical protein
MGGRDVFNWKAYIDNYEDLRKAGINTEEAAWNHWMTTGIKEGRVCYETSIPISIARKNPDIEVEMYNTMVGRLRTMEKITVHIKKSTKIFYHQPTYIDYNSLCQFLPNANATCKFYLTDIKRIYDAHLDRGCKFLILVGDIIDSGSVVPIPGGDYTGIPMITKTRSVGCDNFCLIMMNSPRHFDLIKTVRMHDIPYNRKRDCIMWRGSSTGYPKYDDNGKQTTQRYNLVSRYYMHDKDKINVGFNSLCQHFKSNEYNKFKKPFVSVQDMLKYKFLLSIEGNDVASDLKWKLSSNSLVIMPKPTCISIICENLLEPWVHYVPVKDDFSDLDKIYEWCLNNEAKCLEIIGNANKYIKMFTQELMIKLSAKVIREYCKKIEVVLVDNLPAAEH